MARVKEKPKKETSMFLIRSLTHTYKTEDITRRLAQDATDYIGRTVSNSALIRALIRYADTQGTDWTRYTLFPFIERELESGMVWGKKKTN